MDPRKLLISLAVCVQLAAGQAVQPGDLVMTPKEDAIEELLSIRESPEALTEAIVAARSLEVPEQVILEARFLFHVDRAEDKEIAELLPEFEKQKEKFDLAESEIFASVDDWLAVTEYVTALDALDRGDKAGFKQHITEAFWLSPRQGAAFAPHIDRIRLMDAMKSVRVNFEKPYKKTLEEGTVTLGEILGDRKALLLHFWSPWSRECEATLVDFFITADHLNSKGVAVASMLPETSEKVAVDARLMLAATEKDAPGAWIVDTKKSPLAAKLRVQSVPAVVIISRDGRVLFNGHPTNDDFWRALEEIDPGILRPEMRED
ncbi:MAG: hypothetical protein NWT08_08405 [Akkermansiaceae bacterium]|jgi:hypothetical protein|nr:hypothetical protein [Akkermansiaceae bacterium]MDP4647965.1 hypothetical protein [Akkermansiaceae bacterium]MDP4719755.1 hypothetical protein [Akkermansiaceae bacterium]MDP4781311.1 hypothetical protein [Akkermansiaceae bacterium]MDP4846066.1 hypothetical protein [Akkermansiaceae bacterium]